MAKAKKVTVVSTNTLFDLSQVEEASVAKSMASVAPQKRNGSSFFQKYGVRVEDIGINAAYERGDIVALGNKLKT